MLGTGGRPIAKSAASVVVIVLVTAAGAALADQPVVTCTDPAGCPDLIVDVTELAQALVVTRTFPSSHCAVVEGLVEPGERRLLNFGFSTPNVGEGDVVIGDPDDHLSWYEWGACHGHHHFSDFATYRLWTVDGYLAWREARAEDPDATSEEVLAANPELAEHVVSGLKLSFCMVDSRPFLPVATTLPQYTSCDDDQGISAGWADYYSRTLDGQWVDVTDVAPGLYMLEGEVNPERRIEESDHTNNAAAAPVVVA